ncbi:YoaK family protein [Erythrobacter westpacificensis]|uniref:YoaK family protein n=1 Tax=Erythrobacter westpacificensis TaxID=1055231 RepID=A0ABP9JWA7_9SPHN
MAIGIALLAGFVDATGFLQVDGYYVSFMTGNTTLLALDIASGARRVLVPALLIAGFVLGVALGTWLGDFRQTHRKRRVLSAVIALLVGAASARASGWQAPSLACLVLAMGALNTTLSGNRRNPVGLTYMTGALVRVGQALGDRINGTRASGWSPFVWLWGALLAGAFLGAMATQQVPSAALWIAVTYAALLLLASEVMARRSGSA